MLNPLRWCSALLAAAALTYCCHTTGDGQDNSVAITDGAKTASSLSSERAAPTTSKVELLVELSKKADRSALVINGRGLFEPQYAATAENNLQVVGRQGHTVLLAALESAPNSADIFWVKISLFDLERARVTQTLVVQMGFMGPAAQLSDPVVMDVHTELFFKEPAAVARQTQKEDDSFHLKLTLKR